MTLQPFLVRVAGAIFVTSLAPVSFAFAIGGVTDGGGNIQKSTRSDLENIVGNWDRFASEISDGHLVGQTFRTTKRSLNSQLEPVVKALTGETYFTMSDNLSPYVRHVRFNIIDGACLDDGKPRDASTAHEKDAVICLSASRLARFPRAVLRQIFIPLVLHEVTHQFGFGETEANQIQALAELHLKYRPLYLAAWRARGNCAFTTKVQLTPEQRRTAFGADDVPAPNEAQRTLVLMQCVRNSSEVGEGLAKLNDGDLWSAIPAGDFTESENAILADNIGRSEASFLTMIEALTKPSSQTSCDTCDKFHVDQSFILMLGARMALRYIDQEVGRQQDLIK